MKLALEKSTKSKGSTLTKALREIHELQLQVTG